ncbi:uncharacterized protein CIMG_03098 [Coccidioides immitis RS]|uniref:Uncharacterized protein n=1 Tax=Coccidioides immitis (strain RS) TaxID=246410 RepID=J3KAL7_COCIM|nr:uncharacterized protein CIMG_03098 [Coccidioides immitis RS]EAS32074.3 hypothetical protein CIMG_03098 [Coccidioides immitis RS]
MEWDFPPSSVQSRWDELVWELAAYHIIFEPGPRCSWGQASRLLQNVRSASTRKIQSGRLVGPISKGLAALLVEVLGRVLETHSLSKELNLSRSLTADAHSLSSAVKCAMLFQEFTNQPKPLVTTPFGFNQRCYNRLRWQDYTTYANG